MKLFLGDGNYSVYMKMLAFSLVLWLAVAEWNRKIERSTQKYSVSELTRLKTEWAFFLALGCLEYTILCHELIAAIGSIYFCQGAEDLATML